jgi:hypothetical protein
MPSEKGSAMSFVIFSTLLICSYLTLLAGKVLLPSYLVIANRTFVSFLQELAFRNYQILKL